MLKKSLILLSRLILLQRHVNTVCVFCVCVNFVFPYFGKKHESEILHTNNIIMMFIIYCLVITFFSRKATQ